MVTNTEVYRPQRASKKRAISTVNGPWSRSVRTLAPFDRDISACGTFHNRDCATRLFDTPSQLLRSAVLTKAHGGKAFVANGFGHKGNHGFIGGGAPRCPKLPRPVRYCWAIRAPDRHPRPRLPAARTQWRCRSGDDAVSGRRLAQWVYCFAVLDATDRQWTFPNPERPVPLRRPRPNPPTRRNSHRILFVTISSIVLCLLSGVCKAMSR